MFALYIISAINGLVVGGSHFQTFWVGSKPVRSNFFIFLELGKKSEIFFSRKHYHISVHMQWLHSAAKDH